MMNKIRIITDPVKGQTQFKTGDNREQYQFLITTSEAPQTAVMWGVSAKGALQQIVAIVKKNSLPSLVGAVLQVMVTGDGMSRKYVIMPVELPTPASQAAIAQEFPRANLEKAFPKLFGLGVIQPA
jgi:predicted helicase